jgi:uridine kinase
MDPLTTPDSQDGFMDEVDPATFLMVIRGNTASGKSTTATTLRQRIGGKVALVQPDYFR